jgi:hypothetical protein
MKLITLSEKPSQYFMQIDAYVGYLFHKHLSVSVVCQKFLLGANFSEAGIQMENG